MVDWTERSFDQVGDLAKQIITLSTGIIALSVTFLTDAAREKGDVVRWIMGSSWVLFLFALVAGVMLLMSLAGAQREAGKAGADPPTIDAPNLKMVGTLMVVPFGIGVVLLLVAGTLMF